MRIARVAFVAAALLSAPGPALAQPKPFAAGDAAAVAAALAAIRAGNAEATLAQRTAAADPAAKDFIAWLAYARKDARGDFAAIAALAKARPHWPNQDLLALAAERSIAKDTPAAALLDWFARRVPLTGAGARAALDALVAQGKKDEAAALAKRAWAAASYALAEDQAILAAHGALLTGVDHVARVALLASSGRKGAAAAFAKAVTLDEAHRAGAEAVLAMRDERLRHDAKAIEALLAKTTDAVRAHPAVLYETLRWHRRGGRGAAAAAVFAALPPALDDASRWWKEIDVAIRAALAAKNHAGAYALAAAHRQKPGEPHFVEAESFAGFIALRLTKNLAAAEKHFAAALAKAETGWERARIAYWQGRLAEAKGDKDGAKRALEAAAAHAATFHGQTAAMRLGRPALSFAAGNEAGDGAYWSQDLPRLAQLLAQLGDGGRARLFAWRASLVGPKAPAEQAWAARFVLAGGAPHSTLGIRMHKAATRNGIAFRWLGFPTLDLPEANTVEPAFVFAIIRTESEFMVAAKSHAGARGLMQLMPFTAVAEARDAKLPYALARLTEDGAYNLRLGTQHLQRLAETYKGAYPLMAAAYNAGEGAVDRWRASYGDPRGGQVEWVDWIELIPYEETREYVKLVLEAHAVYRLVLGAPLNVARLEGHWIVKRADEGACKTWREANAPKAAPAKPGEPPAALALSAPRIAAVDSTGADVKLREAPALPPPPRIEAPPELGAKERKDYAGLEPAPRAAPAPSDPKADRAPAAIALAKKAQPDNQPATPWGCTAALVDPAKEK
jgi:soluble lytic murein transglycosylase